MTPDIWVLDASSIIQVKIDVPKKDQWEVLKGLERMVEEGQVAFPREVAREVKAYAHPDAPGVWVHGVEDKIRVSVDPEIDVLRDVLSVASDVVDPDKQFDGDPYVLAMAKELMDAGRQVAIVTEDVNDRPSRIAMTTACARIGIPFERLLPFLSLVGTP